MGDTNEHQRYQEHLRLFKQEADKLADERGVSREAFYKEVAPEIAEQLQAMTAH